MIQTATAGRDSESTHSRRLWSLWDMFNLRLKPFIDTQDVIVQWSVNLHNGRGNLPTPSRQEMARRVRDELLPQIQVPEFDMCRLSAERLCETVGRTGDRVEVTVAVEDLRRRLLDQAGLVACLTLSAQERALYEPNAPLFGPDVAAKFVSVAYEIEEAGKCLALERSTAAAFHAIRCLEAGIRAISRCLGIPDPTRAGDRSWFNMLNAVKGAIDRKWPGTSTRLRGDGEFFDNAYAALAAMQNPWRNATMHLDQKYTPQEAQHVFDVVRGFMSRLASRMDENGDPKA